MNHRGPLLSRKRVAIAIVLVVVVVVVGALLWSTRRSASSSQGSRAGVAEIEPRSLYPGASFAIPFPDREGLAGEADRGALRRSADGTALVYVAPLDGEADSYRVVDDRGEALAGGRVTLGMPPAAELEVLELDEGRRVVLRYGPVHVEAVLEDGVATAFYRSEEPEARLDIRLEQQQAELAWGEVRMDGYGALGPDEAAALHQVSTGPLARAVTMVALDLGCIDRPYRLPAEVYAALLFPWQMILKYEIAQRDAVVEHFLAESRCYFPGRLAPSDDEPENIAVLWDADHSVPAIFEAFPFDGEGQMEALAP